MFTMAIYRRYFEEYNRNVLMYQQYRQNCEHFQDGNAPRFARNRDHYELRQMCANGNNIPNASCSLSLLKPPVSLCDVKMQPVPFYTDVSRILTFEFYCAPIFSFDMVKAFTVDCALGVNLREDYHVLLRMCVLDSASIQADCMPVNLYVKINNKLCSIMDRKNSVNITDLIEYDATNVVLIRTNNGNSMHYMVAITVMRKSTPEEICSCLRIPSWESSRKFVETRLEPLKDDEISSTSQQCMLTCPLGKTRMTVPCRSLSCLHIQCFDAMVYLQMNEKKGNWKCPVCYEPAPIERLQKDRWTMDILEQAEESVTKIIMKRDGTWEPVSENANCTDNADVEDSEETKRGKKRIIFIDLVDDENEITTGEIINLSPIEKEDEDQDNAPKRKRAKHSPKSEATSISHRFLQRRRRQRNSKHH